MEELVRPIGGEFTRNVVGVRRHEEPAGVCLAIIAGVFCQLLAAFAQNVTPAPQIAVPAGVTIEEVIVTGSNIPTAEEVGPDPVDTYRREDITRLGVRTPTDLVLRIPASTGSNTT